MKAILSFRITVDHNDRNTPVYSYLKLYREDDGLIWRIDGPLGDAAEGMPRPATVAQAKADARLLYRLGSAWQPTAKWYYRDGGAA